MTTIGESVFAGCTSLSNIDIPDSVSSIGDEAFFRTGLIKVKLPSSIKFISKSAFDGTLVSEYNVDKRNLSFVSIDGVLCHKKTSDDKKFCELIKYPSKKPITKYIVDDNITRIGDGAFRGASELEEIVLHDKIVSFGNRMTFAECTSLKEIHIPRGVSCLPRDCFSDCKALEHVYVPDNMGLHIEKDALKNCFLLKGLHFRIKKAENITMDNAAFDEDIFEKCTLFIPSGTRWAYRHHPFLGKFKNIEIERI